MEQFVGNMWWGYILLGLISGIISGTLGVGAGIVLVPSLVFLFTLPQKVAQGVSLGVIVPMALAGAISYKLNPEINTDFVLIAFIAVGGVTGALLGAQIADWIPNLILRRIFAILIIFVGVKMLMGR